MSETILMPINEDLVVRAILKEDGQSKAELYFTFGTEIGHVWTELNSKEVAMLNYALGQVVSNSDERRWSEKSKKGGKL